MQADGLITNAILRLTQSGDDHTVRQVAVLLAVQNEPMHVRDLAEYIGVGKPVVSRCVDRLELEHLVTRLVHQTDGRSVMIKLTPKGKLYLKNLFLA